MAVFEDHVPGIELDALVHEVVLGRKGPCEGYSTDIGAAWRVLDHWRAQHGTPLSAIDPELEDLSSMNAVEAAWTICIAALRASAANEHSVERLAI